MSSPRMKIRCPNCLKDGSARAELLNRRVSCKHCTHVFRAVPVDDEVGAKGAVTKVLGTPPVEVPSLPKDRIEALELEVHRLRDQLEQTESGAGGSRDRLREEELRFLRDQLDKARVEVESESRKRREAAASLTARSAEHAKAIDAQNVEHGRVLASKEAEHAKVLRESLGQLDRLRSEAQAVEARRLAADSARTEAENRHADEDRALRDELGRAKGDLDVARKAVGDLHLERDRLASDHARALDELRRQMAGLEARLGEADAIRLDRDRLAGELDTHRSRLAEVDRSAIEHKTAAEGLRLDLDRLEAARSAEQARSREELESARAGRLEVEAVVFERDEALAMRDRLIEELEALRSRMQDAPGLSGDWNYPSTEVEVPNLNADGPTEGEVPAARMPETPTFYDSGSERVASGLDDPPTGILSFGDVASVIEGDSSSVSYVETERLADRERERIEAEAEALRAELEEARAEAEAASRRNLELADRIRALEAEPPPLAKVESVSIPSAPSSSSSLAVDPALIEAERKRAVDEAVKGAWADFERRLAETQTKLRAANARADLLEMEAREAREQATRGDGDGSSFDEPRSMTSVRILNERGTARLTPADAESRLALAKQLAVDRKDKPLIDRIGKMAEKVRADLEAHNFTLAETLVRGAEIETGLDPGGFSIGGLRIFRASPTIVGSLTALAPAFDRVMRQGDLATIRSTLEEMRTILGDQAGLPEIRRVGRTPAVKRPITEADALRLFVAALEAENWLMRPIAAKKPLPDTSLTTYACLVEACVVARKAAEAHAFDRLALLDSVIQASCLMLTRRQQPDGHFSFLDPRGKASKLASVVDGMVAQRPDSVKDGWVVLVDPLGMAQVETGVCARSLVLGRPGGSAGPSGRRPP